MRKKNENVSKIKIIIDYQIKSFKGLFKNSGCIEYIYFKKFIRNNINDMGRMFYDCYSLKELNLSNFNTDNVADMSFMFYNCSSLKRLNISNFNIEKVTVLSFMFYECSALKDIIFPNSTIEIYNIPLKDAERVCEKCPKLNSESISLYERISSGFFGLRKTGKINLKIIIT